MDTKVKTAKVSKATNVYEYFAQVFGRNMVNARPQDVQEFKLDTHCGKVSMAIIDQAKVLLDMCDTHPHVVDNILKGVTTAIEIVLFG